MDLLSKLRFKKYKSNESCLEDLGQVIWKIDIVEEAKTASTMKQENDYL
jgi:hypothetical protein